MQLNSPCLKSNVDCRRHFGRTFSGRNGRVKDRYRTINGFEFYPKLVGALFGLAQFAEGMQGCGVCSDLGKFRAHGTRVARGEAGVTSEMEVARLERDEQAGVADLGLRLAEAKQLTAALQAEMVPAQVAMVGEHRRWCETCGCVMASKGHYTATFRSLFGDVPVRVRRLLACPCQGSRAVKSFAVLDLEAATVAPELAYLTGRLCGAGTIRQGCGPTVGVAADQRGTERGHGAE
jgi:hypothetical protein